MRPSNARRFRPCLLCLDEMPVEEIRLQGGQIKLPAGLFNEDAQAHLRLLLSLMADPLDRLLYPDFQMDTHPDPPPSRPRSAGASDSFWEYTDSHSPTQSLTACRLFATSNARLRPDAHPAERRKAGLVESLPLRYQNGKVRSAEIPSEGELRC